MRAQVIAPVQSKVGAFLSDPRVLRLVSGPGEPLRLRELMDQGGILLVNLAKGELGEGPAALVGSLLVASIGLAGLARASVPPEERRDFYVYLDEFHSFATLSLAGMLSELRKYRVSLILAQQYLSQVEPEIRDAVLGNVGTVIAFRVGPQDAPLLGKEFGPEFTAEDLLRLPQGNFYLRMVIDGAVSRPFSAEIATNRMEDRQL
jgi:type IV secretory pathway TraG/TraD family ATPase VirD4